MNTQASTGEIAFSFRVNESALIGVIHESTTPSDLGVLTIVAGGPQYRGGCGRQLVTLGRRLAREGVHVMRFDHRGMMTSQPQLPNFDGEYQGLLASYCGVAVMLPQQR